MHVAMIGNAAIRLVKVSQIKWCRDQEIARTSVGGVAGNNWHGYTLSFPFRKGVAMPDYQQPMHQRRSGHGLVGIASL